MNLRVGLCSSCRHVRVITSERGSTFYLCGAAGPANKDRPELPKYPPLPVLSCIAYTPRTT